MIAELVYLLLSILIRFTPLVGTKTISHTRSPRTTRASRKGSELPGLALWIPLVGWVAVSVQRSAAGDWLPQRVVAAQWLGWLSAFSGDEAGTGLLQPKPSGNPLSFTRRFMRLFRKSGAPLRPSRDRRRR